MPLFTRDTLIAAHKHSSRHRDEILKSTICGCFHCLSNFNPNEIDEWLDDGDIRINPELEESCALCAKCGIDSVIGSASGYPVTDETFLEAMHKLWF